MSKLKGMLLCGTVEKLDQFDWTDPATGQLKPIRSIKLLLPHGDGTITRESVSIPNGARVPDLELGADYAIPCTASINKKRQQVTYTLRLDLAPFPAPELA